MSPQKNNSDKISASQGKIWLGTIKTAVEQAGGHGARIEEGECDTFLSAHQLLSFCYIAATRPEGCAAGYLIDLIPNHHQLPHLLRDNITVLNGQVVHVSVWFHPETPPQPVLESIQKALKLDGPAMMRRPPSQKRPTRKIPLILSGLQIWELQRQKGQNSASSQTVMRKKFRLTQSLFLMELADGTELRT
jgi:hypothetical protein